MSKRKVEAKFRKGENMKRAENEVQKLGAKFRKGQSMNWLESEAFMEEMSKNNSTVYGEKERVKDQNQVQRGELSGKEAEK